MDDFHFSPGQFLDLVSSHFFEGGDLGAGRAGVLGHGFYDGGAVSRGSDFFPEVLEFIGEEDEGEDEVVRAGEGQGFFECLEAVFFS